MSDPLFFLLGRWYGDPALQWLEAQGGRRARRSQLRWIERKFAQLRLPARRDHAEQRHLPVRRHRRACGLARSGRSTCSARSGGSSFFWFLGKAFNDPLTTFLDWVQRYQWPLLALSVGIVMVQAFRAQSRGEIEPISAIEDEIEALTIEAAETRQRDPGDDVR